MRDARCSFASVVATYTDIRRRVSLSIVLKVLALTIVLFVCFAIAGAVIAQPGAPQTAGPAGAAAALLAACFLDTLVLTYIILRSRWTGWRLMVAVFVVFYGVMTFMSQIESAVFLTHLPPGMLPRLFLMGVLVAAPFSVVSVLVLRNRRTETARTDRNTRLVMPAREWTWKLAVIASTYVVLYFTFGYFIAWRNAAVREYYGGVDTGSFSAHMQVVLRTTWWLIPLQMVRGVLWALLALPLIRSMKGAWPETALTIGLLFAVVMNAQLLIPNPYMPETVRMAHLIETATSNFVFGLLVGWLLARRRADGGLTESA